MKSQTVIVPIKKKEAPLPVVGKCDLEEIALPVKKHKFLVRASVNTTKSKVEKISSN